MTQHNCNLAGSTLDFAELRYAQHTVETVYTSALPRLIGFLRILHVQPVRPAEATAPKAPPSGPSPINATTGGLKQVRVSGVVSVPKVTTLILIPRPTPQVARESSLTLPVENASPLLDNPGSSRVERRTVPVAREMTTLPGGECWVHRESAAATLAASLFSEPAQDTAAPPPHQHLPSSDAKDGDLAAPPVAALAAAGQRPRPEARSTGRTNDEGHLRRRSTETSSPRQLQDEAPSAILWETTSHVHVDITGPLPLSNGCSYLRLCMDRFIRWSEAIVLSDVAAPTVVKAFLSSWVAVFGLPSTITTDRGAQFESNLSQSLLSFLGCARTRTTLSSGGQRDGRAAPPLVEDLHTRRRRSGELDGLIPFGPVGHPLLLRIGH
nr:unnamed protein product [Spirometra erinaceieuropaei]